MGTDCCALSVPTNFLCLIDTLHPQTLALEGRDLPPLCINFLQPLVSGAVGAAKFAVSQHQCLTPLHVSPHTATRLLVEVRVGKESAE